jgi:hypothetical protein
MAKLTPAAIAVIEAAVEKAFTRAKTRLMGRIPPNTPKGLILSFEPSLSIPGLFKLAAKTEGVKHNEEVLHSVTKIGTSYLDAIKAKAKAKTVHTVQTVLTNAQNAGVDTDLETVLSGN